MARIKACVFDAYGTLFDVHSAVRRHAARIGRDAEALSELWRRKQLEYSWTRSLMRRHADFWLVTGEALDFAMARFRLADPALRGRLLEAYLGLDAYPEVAGVLEQLKSAGLRLLILSNGSPAMLDAAIRSAGLGGSLEAALSIEAARVYKPDPRVYQLALDHLGLAAHEISFQSSNAWDAAGARAFGFSTVWVNRSGQPVEYGWVGSGEEVPDLTRLPEILAGG